MAEFCFVILQLLIGSAGGPVINLRSEASFTVKRKTKTLSLGKSFDKYILSSVCNTHSCVISGTFMDWSPNHPSWLAGPLIWLCMRENNRRILIWVWWSDWWSLSEEVTFRLKPGEVSHVKSAGKCAPGKRSTMPKRTFLRKVSSSCGEGSKGNGASDKLESQEEPDCLGPFGSPKSLVF